LPDLSKGVVITGAGIVSPAGIGKDAYLAGLIAGKPCYKQISLFDTSRSRVHIAGEIDNFDPVLFLGKKGLRELDRSTRLVCSAAMLALNDSGLEITEENTHSTGVTVGTTFGSLHSISRFDRDGLIDGPRYVNPSYFPNTVINSPASRVSIRFKIRGFNTTISTGFCAGLDAIIYGSDFIRLGRVNAVLAGGVEELCEETFTGFHALGCLSGMDGSLPVCCPFDKRRNGIVLSEGAAIIVLESTEQAMNRGARILAEVKGYGNSFDPSAEKIFNSSGAGLKNAIILALKDACLNAKDIDYICACANSTRGLDRTETKVIKEVFGKDAYTIPVSSVKSVIGETFSASGALSLAAAIGAVHSGAIPPTINYQEKDPECDLDYVPNEPRRQKIRNALILSSDPYGHNTAVILSKN
jgi:3-oxoacyl-[acyl-carrier-protein] synthase II